MLATFGMTYVGNEYSEYLQILTGTGLSGICISFFNLKRVEYEDVEYKIGVMLMMIDTCPMMIDTCPMMIDTCPFMIDTCPMMIDTCPMMIDTCPMMIDTCPMMLKETSVSSRLRPVPLPTPSPSCSSS